MSDGGFGVSLVHNVSIGHQDKSIKKEEGLGAGRVDRADDCFALLARQFVQKLADRACFKRVKAGGRLIKKHYRWVRNELNADRDALALTT